MATYLQLFLSHFLSSFGDRLWQFAIPILFITIWPDTLLPSVIFNFCFYNVKLFMVPLAGRFVDTTDRLNLVKWGTFGQNTCTCISAALLIILGMNVSKSGAAFRDSAEDTVMFAVLIGVGIVGDIFNVAGTIGVEKDWIVVIADGNDETLTYLNATLRRIDLSCKFAAPLVFGILSQLPSQPMNQIYVGGGMVFGWNLLSVAPIYCSWRSVYYEYPALQNVKPPKEQQNPFRVILQSSKTYVSHRVFGASFAYCCLYFTVLSDHHPLTTAFLKKDGVSNSALGVARGLGGLFGILGTHIFPHMRKALGVYWAGVVAAFAFVICIDPISISYYGVTDSGGASRAYVMLMAIVVSRMFLWCFDLANAQTMQECIADDQRGEVNSMQNATCTLMELMMATAALFCSNDFPVLIVASALGVTTAALILTLWSCRHSPIAFNELGSSKQPLLNG